MIYCGADVFECRHSFGTLVCTILHRERERAGERGEDGVDKGQSMFLMIQSRICVMNVFLFFNLFSEVKLIEQSVMSPADNIMLLKLLFL